MRIKTIFFLALLSFSLLSAQKITVKTQNEIVLNAAAYYPTLNNDGSKLLFSSESYNGLFLYDFNTGKTTEISKAINAGYYPVFSADDTKIFYKNTNLDNRLRYDALESYDVMTGKQQQMLAPQRNLRQAQSYHNGILVLTGKNLVKSTFGKSSKTISVYVSSEDLSIYIYNNGVKKQIKPLSGSNNYIWVSLSPDNKKILFTATGKGTYICDLSGKVISSLGYLNAPVWYNNEYIAGMQDKDNGEYVISSSVVMTSTDGKIRQQISNPKHIAMYPTCSSKSGRIIYNTLEGKLYISEIEIK
ncbi:MAG: hypothetical protein QM751_07845 [Paludibacteraceae bacterium]